VVAATTLAVVASFGGCAAIVATGDGCGFDPPPGDVGQVHVVNDGDQQVDLFACSDATCSSGMDREAVLGGDSQSVNYELCSGDFLGCLALPIGETVTEHTYRASQFDRTCAGVGNVHPRIN
jgi:hypothetical protein